MKIYIERIKALREDNDLKQKEVAKAICKSQQGYDHIENERARLSIDDLTELCKFYNISPEYILGFTNTPKPLPKA